SSGLLGLSSPKRGIRRDAPAGCLAGEGSATPPRRPHPSRLGEFFYIHNLKFYSIFFKKLRGRGAVGQRQFGSRPDFQAQSAFLGAARAFKPEARHTPRRPCGLSCGLGVSDPSPQAPPRQAGRILLFHNLKFYSIFLKNCGVEGQWDSVSLVPDQTDRRKAPSSGLLGLSSPKRGIRRDAPAGCLAG
ncbi:hypothetical protein D1157_20220, partial [Anaerotruncus sp. X29]|nr:hypothetical protein [Anaerotruncus sp. X29]